MAGDRVRPAAAPPPAEGVVEPRVVAAAAGRDAGVVDVGCHLRPCAARAACGLHGHNSRAVLRHVSREPPPRTTVCVGGAVSDTRRRAARRRQRLRQQVLWLFAGVLPDTAGHSTPHSMAKRCRQP